MLSIKRSAADCRPKLPDGSLYRSMVSLASPKDHLIVAGGVTVVLPTPWLANSPLTWKVQPFPGLVDCPPMASTNAVCPDPRMEIGTWSIDRISDSSVVPAATFGI